MVGLVFKVLSIRYRYLFFFVFRRLADFGSLFYRIGSTFNDLIGCRLVILFLFFLRTMKRSEPFIVARKRRRGTNRRAGASIHGFFFFGFSFVFCWIFIFPFFVFVITPTKKKMGITRQSSRFFPRTTKRFVFFFVFFFVLYFFLSETILVGDLIFLKDINQRPCFIGLQPKWGRDCFDTPPSAYFILFFFGAECFLSFH